LSTTELYTPENIYKKRGLDRLSTLKADHVKMCLLGKKKHCRSKMSLSAPLGFIYETLNRAKRR